MLCSLTYFTALTQFYQESYISRPNSSYLDLPCGQIHIQSQQLSYTYRPCSSVFIVDVALVLPQRQNIVINPLQSGVAFLYKELCEKINNS